MASEIRANTLKNRVGLGTVSFTNTGAIVSGIVTANSFSGLISGTTGTFSGNVDINGDLDVDGHTNLDNVSIAGVVTATRFVGETNGLVNVKTYGAVGDGTTDDRAAIQSAINSAKTVFFPAGTYRVGAALTVWDSYTALIGHESLPTIKVVGTGYSGPAVSVQSAGNDINEFSRIENLKFVFDNNSGGPATYSSTPNETNCGVSINGSLAGIASATNRVLRFKMENCRVLGFSNAINLKETTNTLLRRVVIEHEFDQSSTTLSPSNIYCGVNFDGTPGQVGGISPQASVELHQVIFNGSGAPTNTTSMGFRVTGQDPRDIFFEGCETAHGNYGWFIDPSDDDYNIDIHINRPIVDAVDTTGIYVKDWNGYGALTINGGYVVKDANNSGSGIWVENSRGVNITGGIQVLGVSLNNVANDDGIRIKNSKICSVSSSTIMNCRYGISLEDSSNCSVTGNIVGAEIGAFTGGTNPVLSDAIRLFGNSDTNIISGNTIKGASSTYKYSNGILINASTCEENMVSSNVIDDSTVTIRLNDAGVRTNIFDRGKIGISTTSGGKLLVGGGTGSAIEFNDSSTKLEIPATNTLAAYTSGNERLRITSAGEVLVNEVSARSYVDGAGNTQTPKLQVEADDNTSSAIALRYNSGGGAANRRASFMFARTADGSAVSNDSVLGEVLFMGEGNNTLEKAASVRAEVDGTPGTNDMPGRLIFSTSADGSDSPTERLRITSGGRLLIGSDSERGVGGSNNKGQIQIEGTSSNTSAMSIIRNQNNTGGPIIRFGKTRSSSDGGNTSVNNNDHLGSITFSGADGTDLYNATALIRAIVKGSVSGNTIPTDLVFETSATDGGSREERLRIDSGGRVKIGTTSNRPAFDNEPGIVFGDNTAGTATKGIASFCANGAAPLLLTRRVSDGNVLGIADDTTTLGILRVNSNDFEIRSTNNMRFQTGGGYERLRILSSGAVVVAGTSAYSDGTFGEAKLQFNTKNGNHIGACSVADTNNNITHVLFKNPTGAIASVGTHNSDFVVFGTANTERLRIHSTGAITKPTNPIIKTNMSSNYGSSGSLTTTVANTGILQAAAYIDRGNNGWTTSGSNAYTFVCPVDGIYVVHAHVSYGNVGGGRKIWVMSYTLGGGNLPLSSYVEVMDHTSASYANFSYYDTYYFTAGTRLGFGRNNGSGSLSGQSFQWGCHLLQ